MLRFLVSALVFIWAVLPTGVCGKVDPKSFVRSHDVWKLRGGAGPLDPVVTAKVGLVVAGLQSSYGTLAPSKMIESFGATPSDLRNAITVGSNTITLSLSLIAWMSIIRGESLNKAIGVGTIPGIVNCAKALLNEEEKSLGVPAFGTILTGAIYSAVAFACFTNTPYALTSIKLSAVWGLANGLALLFAPKTAGRKGFGVSASDAMTTFALRSLGGVGVTKAVTIGALAQGVVPLKAYGYAWLVTALTQIMYLFITKDVEKCGLPVMPFYVFFLMGVVMTGTLAL